MLAVDIAGAFVQLGDDRFGDVQIVQTDGSSDDVHDGIDSADLVEVYLILWDAVCLGLGSGDNAEDVLGNLFGAVGNLSAVDDGKDVANVAMNMAVSMGMVMWMLMMVLVYMMVFVLVTMLVLVTVLMLVTMLMLMAMLVLMLFMFMIVFVAALGFMLMVMLVALLNRNFQRWCRCNCLSGFVCVLVLMFMAMLMFVAVLVLMAMLMFVAVLVLMAVLMFVAMLMMMVMRRFIKDDVKIAGVDAVFLDAADGQLIARQIHAGKSVEQHLLIGAEVEQCSDGHISADTGVTFQIELVWHR